MAHHTHTLEQNTKVHMLGFRGAEWTIFYEGDALRTTIKIEKNTVYTYIVYTHPINFVPHVMRCWCLLPPREKRNVPTTRKASLLGCIFFIFVEITMWWCVVGRPRDSYLVVATIVVFVSKGFVFSSTMMMDGDGARIHPHMFIKNAIEYGILRE